MLLPLPLLEAVSTPVTMCASLRFTLMFITGWTYKQECGSHMWSEAPSSRGSGLGSGSQAGLLWARAVGDISYEIAWEIPSPLKSVTEMLSHGLNQDFTIHM